MSHLSILSEDEIRYVCSVIPLQESKEYFKHYPNEFAKIMPGFRATSLRDQEQVGSVLFRNRNQRFVSSFIENLISRWLDEINTAINEKREEGENKETALLQILPYCFFANNIGLYFKLTGEEYPEDFLSMLNASLTTIQEIIAKNEDTRSKLDAKTSEASHLESKLEHIQNEQDKTKKKLNERLEEITTLKRINEALEENKATLASLNQTIVSLEQRAQEQERHVRQLEADLSTAKDEQLQLEQRVREEFSKRYEEEQYQQDTKRKPKRPKDLDEFKDYLGYNFENIGVPTDVEYNVLLKDHLSEILFWGKPILISRSTGFKLMKCVSNTIVKTPTVPVLAFTDDVTEKSIDSFLLQDKRILCLDNFVGNYNETTLITLCDKHRDKILFLTVAYDHTLAYVSDEIARYCCYLNLNRIGAFVGEKELTEDPSEIDEAETEGISVAPDARWSVALKEILDELGVRGALSAHKISLVVDELNFCRSLAFDILPYCTDVLKIAPFNTSERLVKYAGNSGRCPYKDLFKRWFS